jgi:hypothetical protein
MGHLLDMHLRWLRLPSGTSAGDWHSKDVEHSPQPLGMQRIEEAARNTSHAKVLHWCGHFKPWRSWPTGPQKHWTARAVAGDVWWQAVLPVAHRMDRCGIKLAHDALGNVSWANAPVTPAPRFVIYCRARRESPYLQFFIDWHLRLGFERIVVLVQDEDRGAYERFLTHPKVLLLWADGTEPDSLYHKYLPHVLDLDPEWVLVSDVDEFLLIDKPSIGEFVAAREQHHGCRLSAVGWRWVAIEHEEGTCETLSLATAVRGESFIGEAKLTKYMVRADEIADLGHVHVPTLRTRPSGDPGHCVENDGTLLAHVTDLVHDSREPWNANSLTQLRPYERSAMLHLETRSLRNMLLKALTTRSQTRLVHGQDALAELLNGTLAAGARLGRRQLSSTAELAVHFARAVGSKALIPLLRAHEAAVLARAWAQSQATSDARDTQHPLYNGRRTMLVEKLSSLLAISGGGEAHGRMDTMPVCDHSRESGEFDAVLAPLRVVPSRANALLRDVAPELKRGLAAAYATVTGEMLVSAKGISSCLEPPWKPIDFAMSFTISEIDCLWSLFTCSASGTHS